MSNDNDNSDDYTFIEGTIKRQTAKAVLVNDSWFPKSTIKEIKPNGILVKKWIAEKKSSSAKPTNFAPEQSESDPQSTQQPDGNKTDFNEDHLVECTIKLETAKATLVITKTGREVWFPKSTIKKAFDGDTFVGIVPVTWMWEKKVESGEITPSEPSESEDSGEPDKSQMRSGEETDVEDDFFAGEDDFFADEDDD